MCYIEYISSLATTCTCKSPLILSCPLLPLTLFRQVVVPLQSFAKQAATAAACQPGSASISPAQPTSGHTQAPPHRVANLQAAAAEADTNADAGDAAKLDTSGGPCSSSPPPSCQGTAAASQTSQQQRQQEVMQAVAAEISDSRIVAALAHRMQELVDSVTAFTQQLKRVKTLQVRPIEMHS